MIRFYNGRVLRFSPQLRVTEDEVWTDAGRICHVGPATESLPAFERQIDLRGDLLIPGFKNAHTHTAMTFLRSRADDMPLADWLTKQVFPHEARVTPEALYDFTTLGILEYLSSGITASFDMYFHNDAYAAANLDCGYRTVICAALNNFDRDVENIEREYLKFNALDPLISSAFTPSTPPAASVWSTWSPWPTSTASPASPTCVRRRPRWKAAWSVTA